MFETLTVSSRVCQKLDPTASLPNPNAFGLKKPLRNELGPDRLEQKRCIITTKWINWLIAWWLPSGATKAKTKTKKRRSSAKIQLKLARRKGGHEQKPSPMTSSLGGGGGGEFHGDFAPFRSNPRVVDRGSFLERSSRTEKKLTLKTNETVIKSSAAADGEWFYFGL